MTHPIFPNRLMSKNPALFNGLLPLRKIFTSMVMIYPNYCYSWSCWSLPHFFCTCQGYTGRYARFIRTVSCIWCSTQLLILRYMLLHIQTLTHTYLHMHIYKKGVSRLQKKRGTQTKIFTHRRRTMEP